MSIPQTGRASGILTLRKWLTIEASDEAMPQQTDGRYWPALIALASSSGILSSLYTRGLRENLTGKVPEQVANLLTLSYSLNTERNQYALTQTRQVTTALNRIGIRPVALKGLANILTHIYPAIGTRFLADLDLLITPEQFPAAIAVFQSLGYTAEPGHQVELTIGHTYPPFTRPWSLEVDLHRTLGLHPCPAFLPAAELINQATIHNLNGAEILIPSPTHLVIHHIMHSQMHDVYRERIAPSLRTLYDFYLLNRHLSSQIDWSAIESQFRRHGQYATLALYLLEAQSTFGVEPPVPIHLTSAIRLRRFRRQTLQNHQGLRWLDPVYYWRAGIQPRTRRLREILAQPKGINYLLQKFYRPDFYARLRSDFR
jgi:hypothetical protein